MRDLAARADGARLLPTTMHVGAPEGEHVDIAVEPWHDSGLRTDLVAAALGALDEPAFAGALPWLTRGGDLATWEADLLWCAAALAGYARFGRTPPGFFVVTRRGWGNLLSGEVHAWHRVRPSRYRG